VTRKPVSPSRRAWRAARGRASATALEPRPRLPHNPRAYPAAANDPDKGWVSVEVRT
jgi:hypothetical protein